MDPKVHTLAKSRMQLVDWEIETGVETSALAGWYPCRAQAPRMALDFRAQLSEAQREGL